MTTRVVGAAPIGLRGAGAGIIGACGSQGGRWSASLASAGRVPERASSTFRIGAGLANGHTRVDAKARYGGGPRPGFGACIFAAHADGASSALAAGFGGARRAIWVAEYIQLHAAAGGPAT